MVRRCRSRMRPDQPIPPFDSTPVTVTKPTRGAFASPATRVTRDGRACRQSRPRPSAQCSICSPNYCDSGMTAGAVAPCGEGVVAGVVPKNAE